MTHVNENTTEESLAVKKRKSPPESSSSKTITKEFAFEPETVRPEWIALPSELKDIDFEHASIAWGKYQPYSDVPPVLTPVDTPPVFTKESPALTFHLNGTDGRARAGTIHFRNSAPPVPTPRFMPVGTKGTLKGVFPAEIEAMKCPMILANTYHLAIQPGTELIDSVFGGLSNFMGGTNITQSKSDNEGSSSSSKSRMYNLLTDSGGFQMVSLAALSVVTENAVVFESPYSGECMTLRPEDSIRYQNEIGADVIMQLDDVISSVAVDEGRFRLATFRTLRWYDRCLKAHSKPETQNLFPILQGHLDVSKGGLRELCLAGFRHRDLYQHRIPGFAIGGLAGGESKEEFWRVVDHACKHLPDDRPRYLMGVGYPLDLLVCTALGVDQYDCVYPTRTARFGVALVDEGQLKLKQHEFALQRDRVIERGCPCQACARGISRARIHALLKSQNSLAAQLLTQHNVCYMMGFVTRMREAVLEKRFEKFTNDYLKSHFGEPSKIPSWVQEALEAAGIHVEWNESSG